MMGRITTMIEVLGAGMITAGAALVDVSLGLVTGGILLICGSVLASRPVAVAPETA